MEDRELIERAQRGDKDAFAELVSRYHKRVYNLAVRMTGNREDAMDVTQEVFLKMYRAIGSFQPEKPLLPWVYRIAWNVCADRGRKIVRSPKGESLDSMEPDRHIPASSDPVPDATCERKEIVEALSAAIDRLGDGYRELVVLFHLEGLPIREISRITGLKETVIKNRLYRGRQMLKKMLEADGFQW